MRFSLLTLAFALSLSACRAENTKRPSEFESCFTNALEPYRRLSAYVTPQSTLALIEACRRATRADGLDDMVIDTRYPSGGSAIHGVPPASAEDECSLLRMRYASDAGAAFADSGTPIEECRR